MYSKNTINLSRIYALKKQMTTRLIPKEGGTAFIRLPSRNVLILRNCSGV